MSQHKPFVPPTIHMKEFTVRAVMLGLVMCVVLGAANAYLGLKAGQTKALQTNSSRAMTAALDVLQGRDANHGKRYASLVDAVSVDDLAAYARAHFKKERGTRLVVRP